MAATALFTPNNTRRQEKLNGNLKIIIFKKGKPIEEIIVDKKHIPKCTQQRLKQ